MMNDPGYSSLTLVQAFCEGSHISLPSSFLTLYKVPHTPKASGICEKKIIDFLRKIYECKMKNPWKTCRPFFGVHRVYGIQNDLWLDFMIILTEKDLNILLCSQRYLENYCENRTIWKSHNLRISHLQKITFWIIEEL